MMSSKKKATEWKLIGRIAGTATGWDQQDTFIITLYDFKPAKGVKLPSGDVTVDFEAGTVCVHDADGEPIETADIVAALAKLPLEK